MVLLGKCRG